MSLGYLELMQRQDGAAFRAALAVNPEAVRRVCGPRAITLLMVAARSGSGEAVSVLLEQGAVKDAASADGETALMFAAGAGNTPALDRLLAADADVNRRDVLGRTALHHAVQGIFDRRVLLEVVQRLIAGGADPTVRDREGVLPADIARHRKWRVKVPVLNWSFDGYRPVSGVDEVIAVLESRGLSSDR